MGSKGRDFNDLMLTASAVHHMHNSKTATNDEGPSEQGLDFLWRGICCHIEIFGTQTQQQIANRAAHHIGLITSVLQRSNHIQCAVVDQAWIDTMNGCWNFNTLAKVSCSMRATGFTQYFLYEFFDHEKS